MIETIEVGRIFLVEANHPSALDEELTKAADLACQHAMQEGQHGILVTRHGYTSYAVAISPDVPYRPTHERHEMMGSSIRKPAKPRG